jgi:hypothetical protein
MKEGLYRRTYSGAHRYQCFIHPTGATYPGATSIMKAKAAGYTLDRWKQRQPLIAALRMLEQDPEGIQRMLKSLAGFDGTVDFFVKAGNESSSAKRDLGTRVHKAIEDHVRGQSVTLDPAIEKHYEGFVRWFVDKRVTLAAPPEYMVVSETQRYGATADLAVWIDGEMWGIDVKTGGAYPETGMQLAAIRMADHAGIPGDPKEYGVPATTRHGVLVVHEDGVELEEYHLRPDREWEGFLACRTLYEYEKVMKEVLAA